MVRRYAEGTTVSVEKTEAEVKSLLKKNGAEEFITHSSRDGQGGFFVHLCNRWLRFGIRMPDREALRIDDNGRRRSDEQIAEAWAAEERRKWRVLLISLKAKLEEIKEEEEDFDTIFLPWIVLPNNQTVGEWMKPQIDEMYLHGKMPNMLEDSRRLLTGE